MLESIRIKNYRSLRFLEADNLARINIVGGRNGSGKTTLLEAIFFALASHQADTTLNRHITRMDTFEPAAPTMVSPEPYWDALFSGYDTEQTISIDLHDSHRGSVSVAIYRDDAIQLQLQLESAHDQTASDSLTRPRLTIRSHGPGKTQRVRTATLTRTGIELSGGAEEPIQIPAVIQFPSISNGFEDAQRLGTLRRHKRHEALLDALQVMEPQLINVEDSMSSGVPSIWADVGLDELVPLSTLGGGIGSVARILLSMSAAQGGIALIDEIESGIHHSALRGVWKSIARATELFDTQIVATTHSYECLQAIQAALSETEWRYHRLERRDGRTECVTYPPDTLDAAFEFELEVR